jgi:hypothetical protein
MLSVVPESRKVPKAMQLVIKSELLNSLETPKLQQHAASSFAPGVS